MTRPADSGGGASLGSPSQLHASGLVFQRFANGIAGLAQTDTLQAQGGSGSWSLRADDVNLGASTTDFQNHLGDASNAFLSFLISAEPQFADAALDLFDAAGDFAAADDQPPPGATLLGTTDNGISVYYHDDGVHGRDEWWVDSEGHTYHQHDDGISGTFQPPPGFHPTSTAPSTPSPSPGQQPTAPTPTPTSTPSSSTPTASPTP